MGIAIKINIPSKYLIFISIMLMISMLLFSPWSPLSIFADETKGTLEMATIPCDELPCSEEDVFILNGTDAEIYYLINMTSGEYIIDVTEYDLLLGEKVIVIGEIGIVVDYYGVINNTILVEGIYSNEPNDASEVWNHMD